MKKFLTFLIAVLFVFSAQQARAAPMGSGPIGGGGTATAIVTDVTNFGTNLSSADSTVQAALDTLDEVTGVGDSTETNQDDAWAVVSGTQSGIDVTYQDATNDVDFVVVDSPQLDGSYGSNGDGIFFFTTEGAYVEWNGEYMVSDYPLKLSTQPELVRVVE